jgi:hypothetical protein
MRIRIQQLKLMQIHTDPVRKPCLSHFAKFEIKYLSPKYKIFTAVNLQELNQNLRFSF